MDMEMSNVANRLASFNLLCEKESQRDHQAICQKLKHVGPKIGFSDKTQFSKLARAGFCYSEKKGIHCFQCSVVYNQWDAESPVGVHRILNPKCQFVNSDKSVNGSKLFDYSSKLASPTDSTPPNYHCGNNHQSLNGLNSFVCPGETPPYSGYGSTIGINDERVQNIRRNLFPNDQNTRSNPEPFKNLTDRKDHSSEFTGQIIHPKIGDKQKMCRESFRLLTFTNPTDCKAEEWARNGFIFVCNNRVQCVYCEKCASFNDNSVIETHKRISPKGKYCCPIVSGIDVGDVSRKLEVMVRQKIRNGENEYDNIQNKRQYPVCHPQFSTLESRLTSFKFWSKQYRQTKEELSKAGFFHTGACNKVICHCCGLAITDWELSAVPVQQHAHLSPTCHFIREHKGDNFIEEMKNIEKQVDVDPSVTDPVTTIDGMIVADPYPDTLDKTLLTAFQACGYSAQQLYQYIVKIFNITCGRYPDIELLKVAVLADGELKEKEDMLDLHKEVIEKKDRQLDQIEQVMMTRDQLTKSTIATLNQEHCVVLNKLQHKDEQLQHKDQQLQHKDEQLQHKDEQLQHKDQRNLQLHCKLHHTRHQLRQQITHLSNQVEQLNSENEELSNENLEKDNLIVQLSNLSRQIEEEKQQIERELSYLATELSRLKSTGRVPVEDNGDNNRICLFCTTEDRIIMFKPCRHICSCLNCLPNFKDKPCPLCRTTVQDWQVVFLS